MSKTVSIVDEYLLEKERNRRSRVPGEYYVTELCGPCFRDMVYGVILNYPPEITSRRVLESGNMIEDWWLSVLCKIPGYSVVGRQLKARHVEVVDGDKIDIHGRIDALVQHPDTEIVIHEVKSQFNNLALRGHPKDEHHYQASFYSAKTGITGLSYDYLDKEAMLFGERIVDVCFRVAPDPGVLPELVARARVLHGFIRAKVLPPKPRVNCYKCRISKSGRPYCRYTGLCAKDTNPWAFLESTESKRREELIIG